MLAHCLLACVAILDPPLVVTNADVITFDAATESATAIAIVDGRIVAVGDEATCRAAAGESADVIDAGGRPLMRGFFDAHAHLISGGIDEMGLELNDARSVEEMIERVSEWREKLPPGEWILGRGFDHTLFPEQKWPDRHPFDETAPLTPVLLMRVDGHAALANSVALRIAGIDETTPDPPGGEIVRDEVGAPTGILKETAVQLVARHVPPDSFERKLAGVKVSLQQAAAFGITSCADHGGDPDVYLELLKRGELTCRIDLWVDLTDDLAYAIELRERLRPVEPWIRFGTLKGFVDGTFGSRTAAMFEPFHDDASTSGVLRIDPATLTQRVVAAGANGFQVALHAIGDRAVSLALDSFEAARTAEAAAAGGDPIAPVAPVAPVLPVPSVAPRHRVEHVQVVRAADIARFATLGVTASIQPCHLLTDRRFAVDRIGEERAKLSYPWRALADAGALLAFGSDYPVESLDPLRNLFAAITREAEDGRGDRPYHPEQCLTLDESLRGLTLNPARAAHRERELGELVAGSLGDVVILERGIDPEKPREILTNRVWLTISGGRIVYQAR